MKREEKRGRGAKAKRMWGGGRGGEGEAREESNTGVLLLYHALEESRREKCVSVCVLLNE